MSRERCCCVLVALCLVVSSVQTRADELSIDAVINAKALPGGILVDANRELADELSKVADAVREGRFDDAAEKLHLLVVSDQVHFYPSHEDGRRYVSSADVATRVLGLLPEEAAEAYSRLHSAAARKLYERASVERDERLLLQVGRDYFNTEYGARALNMYAQLAFDRGVFLHAAHAWERVHAGRAAGGLSSPLLLAKAAVAYGFAGVEARAVRLLEVLEKAHPGARAVIAGKEVELADKVRRAITGPRTGGGAGRVVSEWCSMAGAADSVALMPPCVFSPLTLWKRPEAERRVAMEAMLQGITGRPGEGVRTGISVAEVDGRVRVTMSSGTQADYSFYVPALVHPAVLDGKIVVRRENEIAAYSLNAGNAIWRVSDRPVYTGLRGKTVNRYVPLAGDMGRHTVTVAGGKAYVVAGLRRIDPETYRKFASSLEVDSSSLLALSLSDGGLVWEVGGGRGDNDVVRKAKFLGAPTYHSGRLFAFVKVWNRYHVLCLDAGSGETVWKSSIGPIPTHTGEQLSWQAAYTMELMTERASPVAVRDGAVYLTTNSGLVAAFDAATGRPLWAYRYDSNVSGKAGAGVKEVANLAFLISAARSPFPPQNAVVAASGRVISLPCDSRDLIALDGVTGELIWRIDRKGCRYLVAIGEDRLLLSDPGLRVIATADGSVVHESDEQVLDRPAVTRNAVIASGPGRIVQMDLKSYETDAQDVRLEGAVLGTMVSSSGKLVAANAASVTAYLGFDDAWGMLSKRLEEVRDSKAELGVRIERGSIALRSGRHKVAAEELLRAEKLAGSRDEDVKEGIRRSLYRAFMALAESAGAGAFPGKHFADAMRYAGSDRERAGVLREQVRNHSRAGRWKDVIAVAQSLGEQYPGVALQFEGRELAKGEWVDGRTYARLTIAETVAGHGSASAAIATKARTALSRAVTAGDVDAMLGVWERWPGAGCSSNALFAAAGKLYERATAKQADPGAARRTYRILASVPGRVVRARAAQYMAQSISGPRPSPGGYADLLEAEPATRISFGGTNVVLSNLVSHLAREDKLATYEGGPAALSGPVEHAFTSRERTMGLLRGFDGRAVLLGDLAFADTRTHALCLDTRRDSYGEAVRWNVELAPVEEFPGRIAALSREHRRLAILGRRELTIVDPVSGREFKRQTLNSLGIGSWLHGVVEGDRMIIADSRGNLTGVNLVSGDREWQRNVRSLFAHSLQIGTDVLMCADDRGRGVSMMDARTGRHLHRVAARGWSRTTAFLNRDGIVVWLKGEELELLDPRLGGLGVLKTVPLGGERPILHFGRNVVVLGDAESPGKISHADVGRSEGFSELQLSSGEGETLAFVSLVAGDGALYVLCGEPVGESGLVRSLHVVALKVPECKQLWWREVPAGGEVCRVSGPQNHDGVISLLLRPKDANAPVRYGALDTRTRELCEYRGKSIGPEAASASRAPAWAGSPGILNGRVIVETEAGIVCLRGRL